MIGIYKITNKINNKSYICQSIDVEKRLNEHKYDYFRELKNEEISDNHLIRSFLKYGIENFSFEILEITQKEELNDKEILYIKKYQSSDPSFGYNKTMGGDFYLPTQETKEKLSKIIKELWKD